jgi:hypothetical protein
MEDFLQIIMTNFLMNENISWWKVGLLVVSIGLIHLFKQFKFKFGNYFDKPQNDSEYLIQGKIIQNVNFFDNSVIFPQEYRAIMYKIYQLGIDIHKAKRVGTYASSLSRSHNTGKNKISSLDGIFMHMINTNESIQLPNNITLNQDNQISVADDQKSSIEVYNLRLSSPTLSFNELKNTVDQWSHEYSTYLKEYNDGNLYIFSYLGRGPDKDNNINKLEFETTIFDSSRTFDNIFFEHKHKIVDRIRRFINDEQHYRKKGIPYTLGFLFHGTPGCGKTSTIKAIANIFNRHIIEIQLSRIKTCRELKEIFCSNLINEIYVPTNKKIIVLEDIDCMSDVVLERDGICENNNKYLYKNNNDNNNKNNNNNNDEYGPPHKENEDKLTLSYILNLIDGLNEQNGRVIIMTTNHPDKLDKALIRPGRIDIQIHFQKCNSNIIKEIVEFYYEETISQNISFADFKYTPAEVFQCCQNNDSINDTIELLKN